jgi:hypothetical protein
MAPKLWVKLTGGAQCRIENPIGHLPLTLRTARPLPSLPPISNAQGIGFRGLFQS